MPLRKAPEREGEHQRGEVQARRGEERLPPVRVRVPRVVVAARVDPAAVQPEEAVEEHPDPDEAEEGGSTPIRAGKPPPRAPHSPRREDEDEQTGQVRGDLVVEPGALRP